MPRSVKEWIGAHDDQRPPRSVFDRLWAKQHGRDAISGVEFRPGDKPVIDHIIPLADGGANAETNMQLITVKTHKAKTAREALERAEQRAVMHKHRAYDRGERPAFQTNRNGKFKKHMDGTVTLRRTPA